MYENSDRERYPQKRWKSQEIIEKQSPFDMLIHLGDTEGSEANFKEWVIMTTA